jgi:predicted RNA binding protein YcfA (HicA-like mRNA interferase family)
LKCSELIRALTRDGWFVIRQSGSHMIMKHLEKQGTLAVPNHGSREVGKGLENKIKNSAGLK